MMGSTLAGTPLPPRTLEGWFVLHQLFHVPWRDLGGGSAGERRDAATELGTLFRGWADLGDGGWSGAFRMIGCAADLMAVHFRSRLEDLGDAERAVRCTALGARLVPRYEFLSVVELGLYRLTAELAARRPPDAPAEDWERTLDEAVRGQRDSDFIRRRLYPRQPEEMPFVSFYPMSKRRDPDANWYTLSLEERASLMDEHGGVGRRFAGRVSQVISGAVGLADWEWGVTLFAADPLEFKNVVTEMRFDRASAVYAEFGPFFVGKRLANDGWAGLVEVDRES